LQMNCLDKNQGQDNGKQSGGLVYEDEHIFVPYFPVAINIKKPRLKYAAHK